MTVESVKSASFCDIEDGQNPTLEDVPLDDDGDNRAIPETPYANVGEEIQEQYDGAFWYLNRRSFIRSHTRRQSLRKRESTRSHDESNIKRMCKVQPYTAENQQRDHYSLTLNIEDFQKKKQTNESLKTFPKQLRSYYKNQDTLISSYEDISSKETSLDESDHSCSTTFYAKLSFYCNFLLLVAKTTASALSGSIAIISSLVDSIVDLASGVVIWVTSKAVRKCDMQTFPKGRQTLEPLAIIVLSVIMAMASLQLIHQSVQKIIGLADKSMKPPSVDFVTIAIASATIVVKIVLYLLCRKEQSPTVKALAQDHRNDIISNTLAILCGYLGSQQFERESGWLFMRYVDPTGAIIICLYIIITWWMTGKEQSRILTGETADPAVISRITWLCLNHKNVSYVRSVIAYCHGYNFIVEVDVVLPEDLSFKSGCEIANSLQEKIASLSDVHHAYVKTNYKIKLINLVEIQEEGMC